MPPLKANIALLGGIIAKRTEKALLPVFRSKATMPRAHPSAVDKQ